MIANLNPYLSVNCVVFTSDGHHLNVLLVHRNRVSNRPAFDRIPGVLISHHDDVDISARNLIKDHTRVDDFFMKQYHTYGALDRISMKEDKIWIERLFQTRTDRLVSVSYYALVEESSCDIAIHQWGEKAYWQKISELPDLAFDYQKLILDAKRSLKKDVILDLSLVFKLLPERFTLRQIQNLVEIILDVNLDNRNFRKKILQKKYIIPTDQKQSGVAHKPALLYSFDKELFLESKELDQAASF